MWREVLGCEDGKGVHAMTNAEIRELVEQNGENLRSSLDAEYQNSDSEVQFLTCGHTAVLSFVATWESGQLFQKRAM